MVGSVPGLGQGEGCFVLTHPGTVASWQRAGLLKMGWRDGSHAWMY